MESIILLQIGDKLLFCVGKLSDADKAWNLIWTTVPRFKPLYVSNVRRPVFEISIIICVGSRTYECLGWDSIFVFCFGKLSDADKAWELI